MYLQSKNKQNKYLEQDEHLTNAQKCVTCLLSEKHIPFKNIYALGH